MLMRQEEDHLKNGTTRSFGWVRGDEWFCEFRKGLALHEALFEPPGRTLIHAAQVLIISESCSHR